MNGPTISVGTAARLMRCSKGTVMRLIEMGQIRATRLHPTGHWQVERKSLDEYADKLRRKYIGDENTGGAKK